MTETADWQFELDVHPPGWAFPAGQSWVAGWLWLKAGRTAADVRAWLDDRPILALHGLPRPGRDEIALGRAGPPHTGFALLFTPHSGARLLRFEVRDATGAWREFHRTPISTTDEGASPFEPAGRAPLSARLAELTPRLLRLRTLHPTVPLHTLADDLVTGALSEPLNALPNPPFFGALEEPRDLGWLRYGRILINGWLAHRTEKIQRLVAFVDGSQETTLFFGRARPDIAGVFSELPIDAQVQFVGHVDLAVTHGAPVLLTIFAELATGEKHLAFAQRFTPRVIAGADTPLPPRSLFSFASALWALRAAARRHGLPCGQTRALRAAVQDAWAAYRAEAPGRPRQALPAPTPLGRSAPPAPLRLLVVTHNLNFEGAPRLIFELARYLSQVPGNRVRVLSPQEGPMRRLFESAGLPVEVVDVSAALTAVSPEKFHAALAAVHIDWSATDLVIANTMVSFWAVHLAAAAHKPSLLYVHESSPVRRLFAPLLPPALFPVVEDAFRVASRVVFTAAASRRIFDYLDSRQRFRILPSWLDVAAIDAFVATHPRAALRAKHGVSPDAVVLLNLGTVCERKGQHTFIAAAALLAARPARAPLEFIMVGAREDDFTALLRLQVAAAGLSGVRFVPETSENFDWLRLADVLVCSSFEESSPRVITEAAAFGLLIVTTNVNGIPELVSTDEARLVAPGDPAQLAATMQQALADLTANDTSRATHARQAVLERFDSRVSLPQHLALANAAAAPYP